MRCVLVILACLFLCSCVPAPDKPGLVIGEYVDDVSFVSAEVVEQLAEETAPEERPSFLEAEGIEDELADMFMEMTVIDVSPCVAPINTASGNPGTFMRTNLRVFADWQDTYADGFARAATVVSEHCAKDGAWVDTDLDLTIPHDNYLAALGGAAAYDPATLNSSLWEIFDLRVSLEYIHAQLPETPDQAKLTITIEPAPFTQCVTAICAGNANAYMEAQLTYAYLNTRYDDSYRTKEYVLPKAEGNLETGLVLPIREQTIADSWYDNRANGSIDHPGIDIAAPLRWNIRSCTDGTVLFTGQHDLAGNYVVVRDEFGYEYYYMHMNEPSTHVKRGDAVKAHDVLGRVGKTGDSDGNELHLSIVTDDGLLINPYEYLKDLKSP